MVRGLKCVFVATPRILQCRITQVVRGLKYYYIGEREDVKKSHHASGAWIEIYGNEDDRLEIMGRITQVVRGLKLQQL